MTNAKDLFTEYPAGAFVFKEGDAGADMFIIETGQVDISHQAGGDEVIASLGPGDFFGEAAIFEDGPRYATAVAKSATRVLRIERVAFADVLRQNVEIAVRIMRKMMSRQRRTEQRLHETLAELLKLKAAPAVSRVEVPRVEAPRSPPPAPVREAAPPPAPPKPKLQPDPVVAAPVAAAAQSLGLRASDGQVLLLDAALNEFLVGRPDPVTGIQPEINLGPFDGNRTLSRRHAKIIREGGIYSVREEVGTSNGTFVNGERVKTGVAIPLKPGDKLRFGMVEVELVVV
jgi:cyclic nucleotide-binding protein/FHA domain-containing protein